MHKNQKLGKTGEPTESPETESKKKKKKWSMKRKFNFREKFYLEKTGNRFGRCLIVFLTQTWAHCKLMHPH